MTSTDSFDLAAAARMFMRLRLRILVFVSAAGLVTAGISAVLIKYHSEGVYTLSGYTGRDNVISPSGSLGLQEFKIEFPQLDGEGFAAFAELRGVTIDRSMEKLVKRLSNADTRQDILAPLYGSTRADLRELGDQSKPTENLVLGIRVGHDASSSDEARRMTALLGDFVGETVFRSQARNLLDRRIATYASMRISLENDLIANQSTVAQLSIKSLRLQELRKEFPETASSNPRQIVSIADGGERFLPPGVQLVGIEALLTDRRLERVRIDRNRRKVELLDNYYRRAREIAESSRTASGFLTDASKLLEAAFVPAVDNDNVVLEARNDAMLDLQVLRTIRDPGLRFAAGPTMGIRDDSRIWKLAASAAALALLLSVFVVVVACWRSPTTAGGSG